MILKTEERREFLVALKATKMPALEHRRMNALLLLDDGWGHDEVAEALFLDPRTVHEYHELYQKSGAMGVRNLAYQGGVFRVLSAAQIAALKDHISKNTYMTSRAVCAYVEATFAQKYTVNAMTKLLKRIGFSYKKPKRFPCKADPVAQEKFLHDILEPLVASASNETPLYFMDAVHAIHNSVPAYGWFLKGQETYIKSNAARARISINGAFCLHDQSVEHRQDDRINGASNVALLQAVLNHHPTANSVSVVLDGAPCNHGPDVQAFLEQNPRLKLVKLPPYSPNLNLIERLWLIFKKNVVYNQFYPTLAAFKMGIHDFFATLPTLRESLAITLAPKFHLFTATPQA